MSFWVKILLSVLFVFLLFCSKEIQWINKHLREIQWFVWIGLFVVTFLPQFPGKQWILSGLYFSLVAYGNNFRIPFKK